MSEYTNNYRTLNCWECFDARGKMCHDKDYSSMFRVTGSSNFGHAVCCKPDYEGQHCSPNDSQHICSQPVMGKESDDEFTDVRSKGNLNHQLFAFCPMISQEVCGIANSTSIDMGLKAGIEVQTISTSDLKYREGRPEYRQYDACYYEITASDPDQMTSDLFGSGQVARIYISFSAAKHMNVYIYKGKDRYSATEALTNGNKPIVLNQNYTVDVDSGILVVAYPNKDVSTNFEFKYWIGGFTLYTWQDMVLNWEFEGDFGQKVFIAVCVVIGLSSLIVLCCLWVCCKRCCLKTGRVEDFDDEDLGLPEDGEAAGHETSMVLEDFDEDENADIGS